MLECFNSGVDAQNRAMLEKHYSQQRYVKSLRTNFVPLSVGDLEILIIISVKCCVPEPDIDVSE